MINKLLRLGLVLTPLFGYLEWGGDQKQFVFEVLGTLASKSITDPLSVLHPLTVLPFLGWMLLWMAFFQKNPNKWLLYGGMALMSLLMGMLLLVGILAGSFKIIISCLPFFGSVIVFLKFRNSTS